MPDKPWYRSFLTATAAACMAVCLLTSPAAARERLIIIGTGSTSGVFYPIGNALCAIINKELLTNGVRCIAPATEAAVYNLMALRTGEIDFGLTTSYALENAYLGNDPFDDYGPDPSLRLVARLYSTPLTAVVAGGKFRTLSDLKGKKFNVGVKGSAKRAIAETLLRKGGLNDAEVKYAQQFEFYDDVVVDAFCKGNIDGFIMVTAMPSAIYDKAITQCNGEIMDMPPDVLKQVIAENPSLTTTEIPPGVYNRSQRAIHTLAMDSVLVTAATTPEDNVALIRNTLKDNVKSLSKTFKALEQCSVDPEVLKPLRIPVYEVK